MKLNLMALRTLSRNKRRTFITSFSIAFGIFLAVTFTGSGDYSYTSMINTSAIMGLGHITIASEGYNERPSLSRRLRDTNLVQEKVRQLSKVEGSYPRIMGQAMFAAGAKSVGGAFMGLDPEKETAAHNFFLRSIVKGEMFDDKDGRGAVIGVEMADKLNLGLGKKLIVTVTDKDGELTSELLRISGLFNTGIDLSGLVGDDYSAGGILVDPVMKLTLFKESAFFILLTVFLLTLAASVYPAIRAGRILPVDTIKDSTF